MKRIALLAGASMFVFAGAALADNGVNTNNGTNKNCFGQARAAYAQANPGGVGAAASQRKGDNAAQNEAAKDACQGTPD